MHPERRGQPAGRLDWEIVALDAIGLFFFFIPGVIAFAVDFSNSTIYLPPYDYDYGHSHPSARSASLRKIAVPREKLTREGIADIVTQHSTHDVQIRADELESRELASIDSFWPKFDEVALRWPH